VNPEKSLIYIAALTLLLQHMDSDGLAEFGLDLLIAKVLAEMLVYKVSIHCFKSYLYRDYFWCCDGFQFSISVHRQSAIYMVSGFVNKTQLFLVGLFSATEVYILMKLNI